MIYAQTLFSLVLISQVTPTPVSCITYEIAPFAAIPVTSVASPTATSGACIEEIVEYPKPQPPTVDFSQAQQQPTQYVDSVGGGGTNVIGSPGGHSGANSSGVGGHNELLSVIEAIGAGGSGTSTASTVRGSSEVASGSNFAFASGTGSITGTGVGLKGHSAMLQPAALAYGGGGYGAASAAGRTPANITTGKWNTKLFP